MVSIKEMVSIKDKKKIKKPSLLTETDTSREIICQQWRWLMKAFYFVQQNVRQKFGWTLSPWN